MKNEFSRRSFLKTSGLAGVAGLIAPLWICRAFTAPDSSISMAYGRKIATGPFRPAGESLVRSYKYPDWYYRDAKFGIWAHWMAQCVPEQGDWHARNMYIHGTPAYNYHVKTHGHPSQFGFKDVDHVWKADKLTALYKRAGAKYFLRSPRITTTSGALIQNSRNGVHQRSPTGMKSCL